MIESLQGKKADRAQRITISHQVIACEGFAGRGVDDVQAP
jgi:hypothetical protein